MGDDILMTMIFRYISSKYLSIVLLHTHVNVVSGACTSMLVINFLSLSRINDKLHQRGLAQINLH